MDLKQVTDLSLHNFWHQEGFDAAAMQALVEGEWPQLQTIEISDCQLSAAGVRQLATAAWLPHLQVLDLSGNPLSTAGVHYLASCKGFQQLHTLKLRCTMLGETAAKHLARCGSVMPKLQQLDLTGNFLNTWQAAEHLARGTFEQLQRLDLTMNQTALDILEPLTHGTWPQLQWLCMTEDDYGIEDGIRDAMGDKPLEDEEEVPDLGDGEAGEGGADHTSSSSGRAGLAGLQQLVLHGRQEIEVQDIEALASLDLSGLRTLDLSFCEWDDSLSCSLAQAKLQLESLSFYETYLSVEAVEELAKAPWIEQLQRLNIYHPDGVYLDEEGHLPDILLLQQLVKGPQLKVKCELGEFDFATRQRIAQHDASVFTAMLAKPGAVIWRIEGAIETLEKQKAAAAKAAAEAEAPAGAAAAGAAAGAAPARAEAAEAAEAMQM